MFGALDTGFTVQKATKIENSKFVVAVVEVVVAALLFVCILSSIYVLCEQDTKFIDNRE